MMAGVVQHVCLLLGLVLTLPLFPALLVSQVDPGFRLMADIFLVVILLPGFTMLVVFCLNLLLFCTLHWPFCSGDFGHFGVPFLELLILF